jgi:hypothetical protein
MARKDCFGSIQEIICKDDMTMTQTIPECIQCNDFRDCMQHVEDRDELKKQNMISQTIDMSQVVSNEIGSCLLEFLNRIYGSPLGLALLNDLLLFYEISPDKTATTITLPISMTTTPSSGGEIHVGHPEDASITYKQSLSEGGMTLRIVLLQKRFPGKRKANMGLIAHEVARMFSSDDLGVRQIFNVLSDSEGDLFEKMDARRRMIWLLERWGFKEELNAFQTEMGLSDEKKWL